MERVSVGNVEVLALSDSVSTMPAGRVYPNAGDELQRFGRYLKEDGALEMNFGCFLLRADGRNVLVDTGLGPESQGRLMEELAEAGVAREDVETVVFTHLHGDHTGWNLDRESGQPNFPGARYLVPIGDWNHYSEQDPAPGSFTRDIRPLDALGRLELIEPEYTLSDSLVALLTPGHTPGHVSIAIDSAGERGFILGDVVISQIDVEEPDWDNVFDWDHDVARRTRHATLDRLEEQSALVGASHLPAPGLGRFVRVDGRRRWRGV